MDHQGERKKFTPPRKTSLAPHGQTVKSIVYSPDRILYPMKRVDFDPNGERNPQNRGVSGYERISWDEALDIVASEIKRQKSTYGTGAMACARLASRVGQHRLLPQRAAQFENAVGMTEVHHNPDSWEGWYWGATTTGAARCGRPVGDLRHGRRLPQRSRDGRVLVEQPRSHQRRVRRARRHDSAPVAEGRSASSSSTSTRTTTTRLQLLGGKWIAPRPHVEPALAIAIAYVWMTEETLRQEYVETHTHGFEKWRDYVLGQDDGVPKSPGVAGKRDGRAGERRARTRARMGEQEDLSRRRRLG